MPEEEADEPRDLNDDIGQGRIIGRQGQEDDLGHDVSQSHDSCGHLAIGDRANRPDNQGNPDPETQIGPVGQNGQQQDSQGENGPEDDT